MLAKPLWPDNWAEVSKPSAQPLIPGQPNLILPTKQSYWKKLPGLQTRQHSHRRTTRSQQSYCGGFSRFENRWDKTRLLWITSYAVELLFKYPHNITPRRSSPPRTDQVVEDPGKRRSKTQTRSSLALHFIFRIVGLMIARVCLKIAFICKEALQ